MLLWGTTASRDIMSISERFDIRSNKPSQILTQYAIASSFLSGAFNQRFTNIQPPNRLMLANKPWDQTILHKMLGTPQKEGPQLSLQEIDTLKLSLSAVGFLSGSSLQAF